MGFFKQLRQAVFGRSSPAKPPNRGKPVGGGRATFTPIGNARTRNAHVTDATFSPVAEFTPVANEIPSLPTPIDEKAEQQSVQQMLEREGIASAEAAYLAGEVKYVISSNVHYFQYLFVDESSRNPINELIVGYLDGSVYAYEEISLEEALVFYRASSPGGAVWDNLRVRGTVFGFQKPYRLISGPRVWHQAGPDSIARHEAIPSSGEPYEGYHPSLNFAGAKGAMGAKGGGVDLGRRGGSKKVAYFTPAKAKVG